MYQISRGFASSSVAGNRKKSVFHLLYPANPAMDGRMVRIKKEIY
jgi:hypothetical protein